MAEAQARIAAAEAGRLRSLAEGLEVLVRFHDREVDAELLRGLLGFDIAGALREAAVTAEARAAVEALDAALTALGDEPTPATLDALAVDYADLFLTHGYRVSPSASVWMTEDKLERQMPMFEVREWYAHYDISVPDWRKRADDHLVHELQFVAFLCARAEPVAAADAARFMDLLVLPWLPEFCDRAVGRVRQPFYAAVMRLTAAWLEDIRTVLEAVTGAPRAVREIADLDTSRKYEPEAEAYVPGVAESW